MIRYLTVLAWCVASSLAHADEPTELLRSAKSLKCTYTEEADVTYTAEGRKTSTEQRVYSITYDNIDVSRAVARKIQDDVAGDVQVKWQSGPKRGTVWFIDTAAGNVVVTAVFAKYDGEGREFITLQSRMSAVFVASGTMASGTCKVIG